MLHLSSTHEVSGPENQSGKCEVMQIAVWPVNWQAKGIYLEEVDGYICRQEVSMCHNFQLDNERRKVEA